HRAGVADLAVVDDQGGVADGRLAGAVDELPVADDRRARRGLHRVPFTESRLGPPRNPPSWGIAGAESSGHCRVRAGEKRGTRRAGRPPPGSAIATAAYWFFFFFLAPIVIVLAVFASSSVGSICTVAPALNCSFFSSSATLP